MPRFPSLVRILVKARQALYRFPFVLLAAVVLSFSAIWLAEVSYQQEALRTALVKVMMISVTGIPLFLAVQTWFESQSLRPVYRWIPATTVGALLVIWFFAASDRISDWGTDYHARWILWIIAAHLAVAWAPFTRSGRVMAFWSYNKALFFSILTAFVYSLVLYIGLSVAILSVDRLLGFEVSGQRYVQLFWLIAGVFNTWFFLSGVPDPEKPDTGRSDYPAGLKIFVQYILIPLVTVYLVILYLYLFKIIVEWSLPVGWVSYLVLSFSVAGIFSLLLLYPVQDMDENRWIKWFSRGFYIAIVPLILLMMISIGVRIAAYGITINRYFILVLALWLAAVTFYFLISRNKDIRVIPLSLCLIAILASAGPWGAFQVAISSQQGRIAELLEEQGMLSEQKTVITTPHEIPFETRRELSSITLYLLRVHDTQSMQPFFEEDLNARFAELDHDWTFNRASAVTELMGFEFVGERQIEFDSMDPFPVFFRTETQTRAFDVSGYTYVAEEINLSRQDSVVQLAIDGKNWTFSFDADNSIVSLLGPNQQQAVTDLLPVADELMKEWTGERNRTVIIPDHLEEINMQGAGIEARLLLKSIRILEDEESREIDGLRLNALLRINSKD